MLAPAKAALPIHPKFSLLQFVGGSSSTLAFFAYGLWPLQWQLLTFTIVSVVVVFAHWCCCCFGAVHVCISFIHSLPHSFIFVCFWMWNNYRYKYNDKTRCIHYVCVFHFIPSKFKQFVRLNCYFLSTLSTLTLRFHRISAEHNTHAHTCARPLLLFHCTPFGCCCCREGRAYTFNEK